LDVYWASAGRSDQSRDRAESAGLLDIGSIPAMCDSCELIVSVCPPEFAARVADEVLANRFRGVYLDANAVSPESKREMASSMRDRLVRFVDGGIIGPPARKRQQTWLYVSGPNAAEVACCFTGGPMELEVIGDEIGKASALKMCFAAYSKGSTALALAVLGAARQLGVIEELKRQWARNGPRFDELAQNINRSAPKAWRFVPEMYEIAATLEVAGMPPEFHRAAAEIYARLAEFKGMAPSLDEILGLVKTPSEPRP